MPASWTWTWTRSWTLKLIALWQHIWNFLINHFFALKLRDFIFYPFNASELSIPKENLSIHHFKCEGLKKISCFNRKISLENKWSHRFQLIFYDCCPQRLVLHFFEVTHKVCKYRLHTYATVSSLHGSNHGHVLLSSRLLASVSHPDLLNPNPKCGARSRIFNFT